MHTPPAALSQHNAATPPLLRSISRQQALPCRSFKDVIHAFAGQGRALEVLLRADALAHVLALVGGEELLAAFAHFFLRHGVVAQVLFQADEDDGNAGAALNDLGVPMSIS